MVFFYLFTNVSYLEIILFFTIFWKISQENPRFENILTFSRDDNLQRAVFMTMLSRPQMGLRF